MMRLIDADKLLEHFPEEQAVINGHIRMGYAVGVGNVRDTINAAPTIEAEPVKHGKWIETKEWGGRNFYCSECRFSFIVDTCMWKPMWNYCPNCGAKLEREE